MALAAEEHFLSFEGFRTLKLPRKERFHLRAHARSPQLILDSFFKIILYYEQILYLITPLFYQLFPLYS